MKLARTTMTVVLAALLATPALAAKSKDEMKPEKKEAKLDDASNTLKDAETVLKEIVSAPDKGIPKELLERAECVGVFPGLKKAAFIVGGEFGRGVFTCRKEDGSMGAPAFFNMGGPSVGWQFGGEEADIVLLIMNDEGIDHLLKSKFSLGGEASAAAGPVGRTAQASTDLQLHAQILSWSRSRGLFVGAALKGVVISQSSDTNNAVYGKPLTAEDLLVKHKAAPPAVAESFVKTVDEHTRRAS